VIENELSSLSVPDILKKLTIKDSVYWSPKARDEASSSSLINGFKTNFTNNRWGQSTISF